jgi:ABC-2 type transport system ATP-binding protein
MIKAAGITKKFGTFTALDEVSCNILDGCVYGLVGSNGAGKSTFLRVLAGIYKADSGIAYIDDEAVYENPKAKSNIAFVADELYFLSGASMNTMAAMYSRLIDSFDMERYNELVKIFKLDPKKNIANFSKGMKRQAAIILTLSTRAKYMFFDETFDGLDPVMRNLVKKLIVDDVAEKNATVIITSHSLRELEDICDHLALLHKGGLVLDSDVLEMKITQFKVQVAFDHEFNESAFWDMNITRYRQMGSVANMIVNGDREETIEKFRKMNPLVLDVLPLTLEEVFTYEMEALGYEFGKEMEVKEDEQ